MLTDTQLLHTTAEDILGAFFNEKDCKDYLIVQFNDAENSVVR
nr:hypothetical protein [Neobacillus mesonae]